MATGREDQPQLLNELKLKRSAAQTTFTRKANRLCTESKDMDLDELFDHWRDLKEDYVNVSNAGSDYAAALKDTGREEAERKADDIHQKTEACYSKFMGVKKIVQEILYPTAFADICTLVEDADSAISRAEENRYPQMTVGKYSVLNRNLEEEILAAEKAVHKWREIITKSEKADFMKNVRKMHKRRKALWSRIHFHKEEEPKTPAVKEKPEVEHYEEPDKDEDGKKAIVSTKGATSSGCGPRPKSRHTLEQSGLAFHFNLEQTRLPRFTGNMRDYYTWKEKWESLQQLGDPSGSNIIKELDLLDSLDEDVKSQLKLSCCTSADDILSVLDFKYGHKAEIASLIVEEIQDLPKIREDDPKGTLKRIQEIECFLKELQTLGDTVTVRNPIVARSIEKKLPPSLQWQWAEYRTRTNLVLHDHFDCLLQFLREKEAIFHTLCVIAQESPASGKPCDSKKVKALTRARSKDILKESPGRNDRQRNAPQPGTCTTCGDVGHKGRLFACKLFKTLRLADKRAHLQKAGACFTCLRAHGRDESCSRKFLCTKEECRNGGDSDHNYLLCPRPPKKKGDHQGGRQGEDDLIKLLSELLLIIQY